MTDEAMTTENVQDRGLLARAIGVIVSPRQAYGAVAARPKALGILVLSILIMSAAQAAFLSTDIGQNAALDQQISAMRAFGVTPTAEMVQQMESRMAYAPYTGVATLAISLPLVCALLAGLLLALFTAILGGGATFKAVYAVVAHSTIIGAVQQLFSFPIMYAKEEMSSPTQLSVFFPMLSDTSFAYYLLSAVDLFYLWSTVNLAIGIAVLYKRSTGPVAATLLGVYAVIAVIIAAVRAF